MPTSSILMLAFLGVCFIIVSSQWTTPSSAQGCALGSLLAVFRVGHYEILGIEPALAVFKAGALPTRPPLAFLEGLGAPCCNL